MSGLEPMLSSPVTDADLLPFETEGDLLLSFLDLLADDTTDASESASNW